MENLIKTFEINEINAVRAKDVYSFLGLRKKDYSRWADRIIKDKRYTDNQDYVLFRVNAEYRKLHSLGNKVQTDLILSFNTAKHECMKANSIKGHEIRKYFIEVEKQYRLTTQRTEVANLNTKVHALLANDEEKLAYLDNVLSSKDTYTTTQIAGELNMSAQELNRRLHELGIQKKVGNMWILTKTYMKYGYSDYKTDTFVHNDENIGTSNMMKWTEKGRMFIYSIFS